MKIDMSGIEELAQGFNPASLADPAAMEQLLTQGVFEPKATPEQTAALERLETMLALIEGWVQTVVTAALGDRIPGTAALGDAAPPPRHRRARRTDLRHAGRPGAAAPQDAGGGGAVGAADRGGVGVDARDAVWQHPTCCPAPPTSTSPPGSSTGSSAVTPAGWTSTRRWRNSKSDSEDPDAGPVDS